MLLGMLLVACSQPVPPETARETQGRLIVALLPDEDPAQQVAKYTVLIEAIRNRTGFQVQLVRPGNYEELSRLFSERRVDLAYFGGFTFMRAMARSNAVPLVMRDIDAHFTSYVLVRSDSKAKRLNDLAGVRFSFGSRLSTSGHIMPRYFFAAAGIEPEAFFAQVSYSEAHDKTIEQIVAGVIDAGVVNSQIAKQWISRQGDRAPAVRVLWQSPDFVDYVWAVQPSMTARTRRAIKEVFLTLSRENPEHARFLEAVGAAYFVPAHATDFTQLVAAVRAFDTGLSTAP